jgi:hypothetical protein
MILAALALALQAPAYMNDPGFLSAYQGWIRCTHRVMDGTDASGRSDEDLVATAYAGCTAEEEAVRAAIIARTGAARGAGEMEALRQADHGILVERASARRARAAQAESGLRPDVEAAFSPAHLSWLYCLRRATAGREYRRRNREAMIDAAFETCAGDENAMRAALRRQYNQEAVDSLMAALREGLRGPMREALRR